MMRLLLTILAAIGFVWAALNDAGAQERSALEPPAAAASAETPDAEADAPAAAAVPAGDPATPAPRQFGASRTDARVVIEAKEEAWVRISDADGRLVFMRTLKPGETYRVPNRGGLVLDSGNAKGLIVHVDGTSAPAFIGMVRRSIPLDPETLPQGMFARPRPTPEAPVQAVAAIAEPPAAPNAEPAEKPESVAKAESAAEKAAPSKAETAAEIPVAPAPVAASEPAAPAAAAPAVEPPKVAFDAPPLNEGPKPAEHTAAEAAPAAMPKEPAQVADAKPATPESKPSVKSATTDSKAPRNELLTATLPLPPPAEARPATTAEVQPAAVITPAPAETTTAPAAQQAAVVTPAPVPVPEANVKPAVHVPAAKAAAAAPKPAAPKAEPVKPAALVAPKRETVKDDAAKPASLTAPRAVASEPVPSRPVTGASAVTPSGVISAAGSRIAVEIQKGTLVRLSRPAATVFVTDPEVADIQVKSAGLVYILGKRAGETALFAVDDHERVILSTTLVVNHNISRLRQALRAVAPDAQVDVISVDGSLILTGTVYSAVEAENIRQVAARFTGEKGTVINQLSVLAPNQVNLRVRIAEVSKETLKSFGINWETIARSGSFLFGLATGRDFINAAGAFPRDGATNTFIASYTGGRQDINAAIDALATEGLITVLAEPNLTAMSGETASFLAGGEFPIPLLQQSNNTSGISVEFKTFGVGLAFTPTILGDTRINLRVRPEVSQLSSAGAVQISGFSIPALTTRRAETTVELGSGQSFVIAGLLQNNTTQDLSRVPFLGDMPVLGTLFRSDRFRRNESELVIIVTPYIVRPVSTRVSAPTDGFVPPNDVERIIGGMSYRQQLQDRGETPNTNEGQGLIGPTGFQLD